MSKPNDQAQVIGWLRSVLREQAIDFHAYRRDKQDESDERFGHRGSFAECKTLRCESIRAVLEQTA